MSELRTDRCPVCGADNDCAVARCGTAACASCWCAGITIEEAALARIPPAARGKACLCRRCAEGTAPPTQDVGRARD
jgi:hypothetical protein